MKVLSARQMQRIDRRAIKDCGIPGTVLMERAGLAVARRVMDCLAHGRVVVLAGAGNNGGDGIVAARELHSAGLKVEVIIAFRKDKLSPDCLAQYRTAKRAGVPMRFKQRPEARDVHAAVVVDALFGTGLARDVTAAPARAIELLNSSGAKVVSVDMPSGISADTGRVMGTAVRAAQTVTFGAPKLGHFLGTGPEYTGELFIEDIGFPPELFEEITCDLSLPETMSDMLPRRVKRSHKGDYGHLFIVAGSSGRTGAALLAARGALRSGAGVVTLGVPETLLGAFHSRVTEEMCLPLPDRGDGTLAGGALKPIRDFLKNKATALAIGPGMGTHDEARDLIRALIPGLKVPSVLDADALTSLPLGAKAVARAGAAMVLTPHPGEFQRITGMDKDKIEEDRIKAAQGLAAKSGATVLLKGVPTVTASPGGRVFINSTGNPAMAKAGSGDVLTGIVGALLCQGLGPEEAAALGAYLHGAAGDIAAERLGQYSVLATDIADSLYGAFLLLGTE